LSEPFQVSKCPAPSQAFVSLVRCFFPAPLYTVVLSCPPFSIDYPKAFRLDTRISKWPSFPPSREKTNEKTRMLICRVSLIQCLCRIYWCFEVRTLGKFSTPSSPLWRILGTLSGPGIVNPPQQPNKTVAHVPMDRFSQNGAYWDPAPWHHGIDLFAHRPQVGREPGGPIRFSACRVLSD